MRTKCVLVVFFADASLCVPEFRRILQQIGVTGGCCCRFGKGEIRDITYSPDGSRLAVAGSLGIWIYDAGSGKELALLIGHTAHIGSVAYSPDGKTIAGGFTATRKMIIQK